MSRIGKLPISIPSGVEVLLDGQHLKVTGPKGALYMDVLPACVVSLEDNNLIISLVDETKKNIRGLTRTLVSNMVIGVSEGFEKKLHIVGIGYGVKIQGKQLTLNLGLSHQIQYTLADQVQASSEKDPKGNDILTLTSIDKQLVGQEAAKIRSYRKPEPYKGKGVRYFGESIKLKAGKTGSKK